MRCDGNDSREETRSWAVPIARSSFSHSSDRMNWTEAAIRSGVMLYRKSGPYTGIRKAVRQKKL